MLSKFQKYLGLIGYASSTSEMNYSSDSYQFQRTYEEAKKHRKAKKKAKADRKARKRNRRK